MNTIGIPTQHLACIKFVVTCPLVLGAHGEQLFWGAIGVVSSLVLLGAAKTTSRLKRWLQGESFSTTRDRNASDTFYDPPPTQGEH